jgi:HK97 family phage major capsid protein
MKKTPRAPRASTHNFANLGQWLRAIRAATFGNTRPDERLVLEQRSAAAGASEAVPSDGGYAVPVQFASEIMERAYLNGQILQRCTQVRIDGTNSFAYPVFDESSRATGSRFGGLQVYWEQEAQNLTPAVLQTAPHSMKPSFSLNTLTTKKLTGLLYVSDELSIDSNAFDTWASMAFGSEIRFVLEQAIISGTGAGQPLGILSSPALVTVAKQSGQTAGTVETANIQAMLGAFWSASYVSGNAMWLYSQSIQGQLAQLTTDVQSGGSEARLWNWRTTDSGPDRLCGLPAYPSEYCLPAGSTGDLLLIDPSRYLVLIKDQIGSVSLHVRFLTSESTFKFILRCDGAPIDKVPVSPLNAGSPPVATSPFVVLGPR